MKKDLIRGLSDRRLQVLIDEGMRLHLLKRGIGIYGGFLFLGTMLSLIVSGDGTPTESKIILLSFVVSIAAGLLFGCYLWHAINAEYARRNKGGNK